MGFWDKGDFVFEKRDRLHMENLYGDDIERCPFLRNLWFCTDVMFSLNGRDMDKQGGQKKSRGGPQKPHRESKSC